jgi:hypothetical protein
VMMENNNDWFENLNYPSTLNTQYTVIHINNPPYDHEGSSTANFSHQT